MPARQLDPQYGRDQMKPELPRIVMGRFVILDRCRQCLLELSVGELAGCRFEKLDAAANPRKHAFLKVGTASFGHAAPL
jgi:hypothetical protein